VQYSFRKYRVSLIEIDRRKTNEKNLTLYSCAFEIVTNTRL